MVQAVVNNEYKDIENKALVSLSFEDLEWVEITQKVKPGKGSSRQRRWATFTLPISFHEDIAQKSLKNLSESDVEAVQAAWLSSKLWFRLMISAPNGESFMFSHVQVLRIHDNGYMDCIAEYHSWKSLARQGFTYFKKSDAETNKIIYAY